MRLARVTQRRSVLAFCFVVVINGSLIFPTFADEPAMVAHFIDVGQADATLLEFPCGAVLIDAGAQDQEHVDHLVAYIGDFFERRTDLNGTLDVVFVTHTHVDHNCALMPIVSQFEVETYVDNGMVVGKGKAAAKAVRDAVSNGGNPAKIREISDADIVEAQLPMGLTDSEIDPIQCDSCDPEIHILSGRLDENPGWPEGDFNDQNNQSLAIRVDFGEASFLFTGDMEVEALDTMVYYYADELQSPDSLDVDVYQVGHHGSYNGTTDSILEAMSPKIAVISMGLWSYGKDTNGRFNTWHYGHPRESVVEALKDEIHRRRAPVEVHVFERAQKPKTITLRKSIYATGWDGTVDVRATLKGKYRVTTEGH